MFSRNRYVDKQFYTQRHLSWIFKARIPNSISTKYPSNIKHNETHVFLQRTNSVSQTLSNTMKYSDKQFEIIISEKRQDGGRGKVSSIASETKI